MSPPSPHDPARDPSAIDELFELLSDESRRRVLYYLRENDGTADVDELREYLSDRTGFDPEEASVMLNNVTLPKLDDSGAIEYESNGERVQYEGGPFATELLKWIGDRERMEN